MPRDTLASSLLRSYDNWDNAHKIAADLMEHQIGCDCTECCAIRVEAVRAAAATARKETP